MPALIGTFFFSVIGKSSIDVFGLVFNNLLTAARRNIPFLERVQLRTVPRKFSAAVYLFLLLSGVSRFFFYLTPIIMKECQYFLYIARSEDTYKLLVSFLSSTIGQETMSRLESILLSIGDENVLKFSGYIASQQTPVKSVTHRFGKLLQYYITGYLNKLLSFASAIISNSTNALMNVVIALLFSSMV